MNRKIVCLALVGVLLVSGSGLMFSTSRGSEDMKKSVLKNRITPLTNYPYRALIDDMENVTDWFSTVPAGISSDKTEGNYAMNLTLNPDGGMQIIAKDFTSLGIPTKKYDKIEFDIKFSALNWTQILVMIDDLPDFDRYLWWIERTSSIPLDTWVHFDFLDLNNPFIYPFGGASTQKIFYILFVGDGDAIAPNFNVKIDNLYFSGKGIRLTPDRESNGAVVGNTATFYVEIERTLGSGTDTYNLFLNTSGLTLFNANMNKSVVTLPVDGKEKIGVNVAVPSNADIDRTENVLLSATSQTLPSSTDSVVLSTKSERGTVDVQIDLSTTFGSIKPLYHGHNVYSLQHGGFGYNDAIATKYAREINASLGRVVMDLQIGPVFPISGNPLANPNDPSEYNFTGLDHVVNALINASIEPYMVIAYMPQPLSSNPNAGSYSNYPPRDNNQFADFIKRIVMHYNDGWKNGYYYGIKFWEIWNEPDILYWRGTEQQYFEMYASIAMKLKNYNSSLKVGGPTLAEPYSLMMDKFLKYMETNNIPVDFVSFHRYTNHPELYGQLIRDIKMKVSQYPGLGNPLIILDEWGHGFFELTYPENVKISKSIQSALFSASVLTELIHNEVDYAMRFLMKDISKNDYFGLLTYNDTIKPAYYSHKAFDMLNETRTKVKTTEDLKDFDVVSGKSDERLTIIITNRNFDEVIANLTIANLSWRNNSFEYQRYILTQESYDTGKNLYLVDNFYHDGAASFQIYLDIPGESLSVIRLVKIKAIETRNSSKINDSSFGFSAMEHFMNPQDMYFWGDSNLIDGDYSLGHGWLNMITGPDPNDANQWAYVKMNSTRVVDSVKLVPAPTTPVLGFPVDFSIQLSDDSITWKTVVAITSYPRPESQVPQTFIFSPQNARYVRVYISKMSAENFTLIMELEVYNGSSPNYALKTNGGSARASFAPGENTLIDYNTYYTKLFNSGVKYLRAPLDWNTVEQTKGVYWELSDLRNFDVNINYTFNNGIKITGLLGGTNPLYDNDNPPVSFEAVKAFGNYSYFVANRFRDKIKYWEIWNEANYIGGWTSVPNASQYTTLLKEAAIRVREANPDAKIIFAGTALFDFKFVKECLDAGASAYFDIMAYHPYRFRFLPGSEGTPEGHSAYLQDGDFQDGATNPYQSYAEEVNALKQLVHQYKPDVELWANEWGWGTDALLGENELTQSKYLTRALLYNQILGINKTFWLVLADWGTDQSPTSDPGHMMGLLKFDFRTQSTLEKLSYRGFQVITSLFDETVRNTSMFNVSIDTQISKLKYGVFQRYNKEVLIPVWNAIVAQDSYLGIIANVSINNARLGNPVAIDALTGVYYPLDYQIYPDWLVLKNVSIKDYPLIIRLTMLPDIAISPTDISFSDITPAAGAPITINATIHNFGIGDAERANVTFYDGNPAAGGTRIGTVKTITNLPPNGTVSVASDKWSAPAGRYEIYVVISDTIPVESNISNNQVFGVIVIGTEPSEPRNLTAAAGNSQVALSWQSPLSDGGFPVTNYRIYRNTSLLTQIGTNTSFIDYNVLNGVIYTYQVSAVNGVGEGNKSNSVQVIPMTTPSAPQNLTAIAGNQNVSLSWQQPLSDGGSPIINYRIYRNGTLLIEVGTNTSLTDTSVINGVVYTYEVSAVNLAGEGNKSAPVTATPTTPETKTLRIVLNLSKTEIKAGESLTIAATVYDNATNVLVEGANVSIKLSTTDVGMLDADCKLTDFDGKVTFTFTAVQNVTENRTITFTVKVKRGGYSDAAATGSFRVLRKVEQLPQPPTGKVPTEAFPWFWFYAGAGIIIIIAATAVILFLLSCKKKLQGKNKQPPTN